MLAPVFQDGMWSIVRFASDGSMEYAMTPVPGQDVENPYVLATGVTEFLNEVPDEALIEAARDQAHLETLRHLGLKANLCIPLQARGRTLGTVTFAMSDSGRRYGTAEVE